MNKADIDRYVRPEDIPLLDQAVLEPIVTSVAKEMHANYPEQTVEEWVADLQRALLRGDLVIVIDDKRRRVGLVRTDEPPFTALVNGKGLSGVDAANPLDLRKLGGGGWDDREPSNS